MEVPVRELDPGVAKGENESVEGSVDSKSDDRVPWTTRLSPLTTIFC